MQERIIGRSSLVELFKRLEQEKCSPTAVEVLSQRMTEHHPKLNPPL